MYMACIYAQKLWNTSETIKTFKNAFYPDT